LSFWIVRMKRISFCLVQFEKRHTHSSKFYSTFKFKRRFLNS
jgi:hypothetical protein